MSRTLAERAAAVSRLVDAARLVAKDPAIAAGLVASTGLSRQGVALALAEHLELSPGPEDVRRLVEGAGDAPRVHVILSSNVFVAALRALAVARATAEKVTVAASRREPVFARALVERAADPCLTIERPSLDAITEGEVHVYGRDETIRQVRDGAHAGVRIRAHGTGLGVALVTRTTGLADAAAAIVRDVVPFDQRGCLSPRIVVALRPRVAEGLAAELHGALASMETTVPRGVLDPDEASAATRYASTVAFAGKLWPAKAHLVGLAPRGAPLTVPPPGRHLHVVVADDVAEARGILANVARFIVAVGADAPELAGDVVGHRARVSALGQMQRPPLDGPVDLRNVD